MEGWRHVASTCSLCDRSAKRITLPREVNGAGQRLAPSWRHPRGRLDVSCAGGSIPPCEKPFLSGVGGQLAQCSPHFSQAVAHKGKGLGTCAGHEARCTLGLGLGLGLLKGGYKVLANRPGHRARHTPQTTTSDVWCGLSPQCPQGSKAGSVLEAKLALY